jgi:pimeloyl-ACP methyl ester carboxylesterase
MILDYKNIPINYSITGKGSSVVLLHGFLETIEMWNDIIPQLSETHQVIAIDLLGHGQTGCLGYIHTMEMMADTVFAILKHHNIERADFIGHSMGGYVALAMAAQNPQLFTGLCLMNSTYNADDDQRKVLRTRANTMAQTKYENLVRMSFANLFAPKSREAHKAAYENALNIALQTPVQGYIAAQEGMKLRPNRFEILKNLKCKKCIVIGKKDALIDGKKLEDQIKNTSVDCIELSEGHMSHIENKSELSYLIIHFIEKQNL